MSEQWAIRPYSRAVAVCLACVLFFAEFIFITLRFQSKVLLEMPGLAPWKRMFGYTGYLAQAGVLAVMLYVFFRKDFVLNRARRLVAHFSPARFARFLPAQLLLYAVFVYLSREVFQLALTGQGMAAWAASAWLVCGLAVVAVWLLGMAPARQWTQYFVHERGTLLVILPLTLAAWMVSLQSQGSWNTLADQTFAVSAWLLGLYGGDLVYLDAGTKVLGLGDFAVSIAPQCSGYEGIGLVLTFTALYMLMNRKELKFPRALVLFPLGAACIWFLNCLRIAVLIIMGHVWSPAVAVGGFHSQAGWITFIATSIALLWVIDNSRLLRKAGPLPGAARGTNRPEYDKALATLVPLVVLLAATLLTSALASSFDYLYALRVVLVCLALYKLWPLLRLPPYRPRWEAALAAVLVAVVWAWLLGFDAAYNAQFQAQLDAMPTHWAWLWLALRFAGAVVTVPIAEELAFRGYLMCRLSATEVHTSGPLAPRLLAIAASSLAFGALHNAWIAGTFAGLVYAVVRLRSQHIGDAILAHALTNALLFALALYGGYWNLL
jgi:exosortase E/protease (VPEID-CTERM system)